MDGSIFPDQIVIIDVCYCADWYLRYANSFRSAAGPLLEFHETIRGKTFPFPCSIMGATVNSVIRTPASRAFIRHYSTISSPIHMLAKGGEMKCFGSFPRYHDPLRLLTENKSPVITDTIPRGPAFVLEPPAHSLPDLYTSSGSAWWQVSVPISLPEPCKNIPRFVFSKQPLLFPGVLESEESLEAGMVSISCRSS